MAPLAKNRDTQEYAPLTVIRSYPVKAGVHIFGGSGVVLDNGYAKPAVTATGLISVGRADEEVDNTDGNDGDLLVQVEQGVFCYANGNAVTLASVGLLCYFVDDQTVSSNAAGKSIAGTIEEVTADGVWVACGLQAAPDAATLTAFQASIASVAGGAGASLVGIQDAGGYTAATELETAIAQIFSAILGLGVAPQALSGAGALNLTSLVTLFTSTGGAQALTLANGTHTGQLKLLHHTVDGGSGVLTPTTVGNFATITVTNVHEWALLQWSGTAWNVIAASPLTVIA